MANKYQIKKELFMRNMSKDEAEAYIDLLIRDIYQNYFDNEGSKVQLKINDLNEAINILGEKYPRIEQYVNYRVIIISNKIFKSVFKRDSDLYYPLKRMEIDSMSEAEKDFSEFMDDDLVIQLAYGLDFEECLDRVLEFIEDLPRIKNHYGNKLTINNRVPRKCIARITDFMRDVKEGKYDGYLEIPEDYEIHEDDYLDRFEYCEKRHKENAKRQSSEGVFGMENSDD